MQTEELRTTTKGYVYLLCVNHDRDDHEGDTFAPQVYEDEEGRFYRAECPECGSFQTEEVKTETKTQDVIWVGRGGTYRY